MFDLLLVNWRRSRGWFEGLLVEFHDDLMEIFAEMGGKVLCGWGRRGDGDF